MKKIIVENLKDNKNIRISNYVSKIFPSLNKKFLFKTLRNKDIRVNGKKIADDIDVKNGDEIEIYIIDKILFDLPDTIDYVYEDDNLLVAYKPCGIISTLGDKTSLNNVSEPSFYELVLNDYISSNKSPEEFNICHRLDRNTAGLVIFAKNEIAYTELLEGFKNGYIDKSYLAYVFNRNFEKKSNTLNGYILKDPSNGGFSKIVKEKSKDTLTVTTHYTVLNSLTKYDVSLLKVKIPTGRTHQIRVHMASILHPLVGDSKYGDNELNKKIGINKQMLFAYEYSFKFPDNFSLNYLNKIIISRMPNDKRITWIS